MLVGGVSHFNKVFKRFCPLGSFSDMEYYFYQLAYWDLKVPNRFVGLNQMQCSPSFDWTGANKMTSLHVGTSYTHDFRFYSKGNASATHQRAWAGSLKPQIAWAARGKALTGHPPYSLFRPKGGRKTINFFTHFMGLSLTPITNI